MPSSHHKLLKSDIFGRITLSEIGADRVIVRDARPARWWARAVARRLLSREARALAVLDCQDGIPELVEAERERLLRRYIDGTPMHVAAPTDPAYFRCAMRLLRRVHRLGVVHNDLAKEANWIVTPARLPALVDFQLAWHAPRRGRLFRLLAREDLRHLLKHKRTYCPSHLTERERCILSTPSLPSRMWMRTGKPVYLFVTRRLLGWADREGAADR